MAKNGTKPDPCSGQKTSDQPTFSEMNKILKYAQ